MKASSNVKAVARVQVTLEMDAGSVWGSECPISQVHDQAKRDVLDNLERKLGILRIVGRPEVTSVLVTEEYASKGQREAEKPTPPDSTMSGPELRTLEAAVARLSNYAVPNGPEAEVRAEALSKVLFAVLGIERAKILHDAMSKRLP